MTSDANWVGVHPTDVPSSEERSLNNDATRTRTSPYDVPEAVRGRFDPSSHDYIVDFRYLDDDETAVRTTRIMRGVDALIGKHSGRVHKIVLANDREQNPGDIAASAVLHAVKDAIQILTENPKDIIGRRVPKNILNYEAAKETIHAKQDKIMSAFEEMDA